MPNPVDLPHPTLKKFCLEPFGAIYRQESAHQKGRERFTDSPEGARECLPTHRRRFSTFRLLISKWPQMAFYGFKLPFGVIWSIRNHFPLKQKRSSDCCTISYTVVIEVIRELYGRYHFLRQLLERFSTLLLLISKWPFAVSHCHLESFRALGVISRSSRNSCSSDCCTISYTGVTGTL